MRRMNDVDKTHVLIRIPRTDLRPRQWLVSTYAICSACVDFCGSAQRVKLLDVQLLS